MGFPGEEKLKVMREKLEKAEPSRMLPKNATKAEKLKYAICEKFVVYLLDNKMTQVQLSKKLGIDPARVNEIVKYRIDLFTVDKLLNLSEKLKLNFEVEVA